MVLRPRDIRGSPLRVTFLGTASASSSPTRNQSSLGLQLGCDIWLFDCGEGTVAQLHKSSLKMGHLDKVFLTHTHGDHINGLVPLMDAWSDAAESTGKSMEIYGPLGTRAYVRSVLKYTHSMIAAPYAVHELRTLTDPSGDYTELPLHRSEVPGRDVVCDEDGLWRNIFKDSTITVDAGPIHHTVACVGYVLTEAPVPGKINQKEYIPHIRSSGDSMSLMTRIQAGERVTLKDGTILEGPPKRPGRRIAILGDTYDASPIAPLCQDVDLLVHEATNAYLPGIDPNQKETDTVESVQAQSKDHGHSTCQVAGAFARRVGARNLILNHFSARYPDPSASERAELVMREIGRIASEEFGKEVVTARDFLTYDVQTHG